VNIGEDFRFVSGLGCDGLWRSVTDEEGNGENKKGREANRWIHQN
jgi:hypothetical protein